MIRQQDLRAIPDGDCHGGEGVSQRFSGFFPGNGPL
jgi:hypothetical protein